MSDWQEPSGVNFRCRGRLPIRVLVIAFKSRARARRSDKRGPVSIWQTAEISFWQQVIPHGRVVAMADADHYLIIQCLDRVTDRVRAFLLGDGHEIPVV